MNIEKLIQYFLSRFPELSDEDWLEERTAGVGGSEISILTGENPYKTPYELYYEKLGEEHVKQTNAMRRGKYLEPLIAEIYEEEVGNKLIPIGQRQFYHPQMPWIRGTPDRLFVPKDTKNTLGIVEIKSSFGFGARAWESGVPIQGINQARYYAGIIKDNLRILFNKDLDIIIHLAYYVNDKFDWIDIPYYDVTPLYEAATDFYNRLCDGIPPEPTTYDDIRHKWKEVTLGKVITGDDAVVDWLKERASLLTKRREWTQEKDEITQHIATIDSRLTDINIMFREYLGDSESIEYNGKSLLTCKKNKDSEQFDLEAFKQKYPNAFERFKIVTPGTRVLRYSERNIEEVLNETGE